MGVKLTEIADTIGSNWRNFCVLLGLSWNAIYHILSDNQFRSKPAIIQALTTWQRTFSEDEDVVLNYLKQKVAMLSSKTELSWEDGDVEDDIFIYQIAEEVGGANWKELGYKLDFSQNEIECFESDHKMHVSDAIMEMLVKYRHRKLLQDKSRCIPDIRLALQQVRGEEQTAMAGKKHYALN